MPDYVIPQEVREFREAMNVAVEYVRPYWQMYQRLYLLWRNRRISELNKTQAKVMLALGHTAVQDRLPKLLEGAFGAKQRISLSADTPLAEPFVSANEAWLQDLLYDKIGIQHSVVSTLQNTLIGGTGYRRVYVDYEPAERKGQWRPKIRSAPVEFFHVLPQPGGGAVNPGDRYGGLAVPGLFWIDWWHGDKIAALAKKGRLNKEGVQRMFEQAGGRRGNRGGDGAKYPEDEYRNAYSTVGNATYGGPAQWQRANEQADPEARKYRVVHWFRRGSHRIIGEDSYLLYDGPPVMPGGYFPLVKYCLTPDLDNWFGVSYLELLEDIIKTLIVNLNLRVDHLAGVMFPTTWVRQDIARDYPPSAFRPKPYDVKFFPQGVENIQQAVWYDRRPDVSPDTFIDEDRLKAMLQKISGLTETTGSLQDVVGNRTATGVTSILNELSGRPTMEGMFLEATGLREECKLLMAFSAQHFRQRDGRTEFIRAPGAADGFRWIEVDPEHIQDHFTVETTGTRALQESNLDFQKLLAMYPLWNQSPAVDQYELLRQSMEVARVLPRPDRVAVPPGEAPASGGAGALLGAAGQPGGAASAQDIRQPARSTANREVPQPGGGSRPAAAV